jgi:hypothetical protein
MELILIEECFDEGLPVFTVKFDEQVGTFLPE